MIAFEDLVVGAVFDLGSSRLGREEVVEFARAYDPLLVDEVSERPVASGWLLPCVWMRHWLAFVERRHAGANSGVSALGPSPGIDKIAWPSRAFAGDTVFYGSEVLTARPSRSRPAWGLVSLRNTAHRAEGPDGRPCVVTFVSTAFVRRATG